MATVSAVQKQGGSNGQTWEREEGRGQPPQCAIVLLPAKGSGTLWKSSWQMLATAREVGGPGMEW